MSFKWFTKSSEVPNGVSANERFTERLNNVWFNFDRKSRFHPGRMIKGVTRLGKFLTDLNLRVMALENASKPAPPMDFASLSRASSTNRTDTSVAAMYANTQAEVVAARAVREMLTDSRMLSSTRWENGLKITVERQ